MERTAEELYERRWFTLVTLCLCILVIGLDNTILNVALPTIVARLHATGSQLQWMIDAYTLVFAGLLLTAGSIGDRFGRRRALTFGLVWFGGFSLFAVLAKSPGQLILARGLMAIGSAFIFPTTLSILTNTFRDPAERSRAIGVWAGVSAIGIAVGPLLGGLLVENFGWGSVFFINVPVSAAALGASRLFIPGGGAHRHLRLDPFGAVLSIAGLVALLYGVIEAPDRGWTAPVVLAGFAVGITFLGLFWWWELRNPTPMLDVKFFRNPRFTAASATITIMMFVMYASTFLMAEYFQFILHYSPLKAGAMLTPVALGLMLGAPMAPRFVAVHGTKRVVVSGLILVAGMTACYTSDTLMSSFAIGFAIRFVYGVGIGTMTAPLTESIMGSLPPERAGVGSAVNDTTRQTGGATGVAVLGSVFAAVYHRRIGSLSFVPVESRRLARESIGTSLQVAARLPAEAAQRLHVAARLAFLSSMRATFSCGVIVTLIALFVAARYLPANASLGAAVVPAESVAHDRAAAASEPSPLARPSGLVLDDNVGG